MIKDALDECSSLKLDQDAQVSNTNRKNICEILRKEIRFYKNQCGRIIEYFCGTHAECERCGNIVNHAIDYIDDESTHTSVDIGS